MPATKTARWSAAACFAVCLFQGGTVGAAELPATATAPTNPPPMQVSLSRDQGPDVVPLVRAYVTAGTNQFALLVPAGFRVREGTGQGKLFLINASDTCSFTFAIIGALLPDGKELEATPYRELLLSRHPGAQILDEYPRYAANRTGPAFELRWTGPAGLAQSARVAFIPSAAGVLEFNVITSADKFAEFKDAFNTLLATFRASENGKLEVDPISTKL